MCIYQFLIAVRQDGNVLQNEDGETTRYSLSNATLTLDQVVQVWVQDWKPAASFSHLMGMFYRTIRMLEHGIKPVYVFDGKPPQLKSAEVSVGSHFSSDFLYLSQLLLFFYQTNYVVRMGSKQHV